MGSQLLISVKDLSKRYGTTEALTNLSFSLASGEILGLLGPNGAGKTTTLHILLGLLTASSGEVSVLGKSPIQDRHQIALQTGFSSAYGNLPQNLKVIENMKTYARLYGVYPFDQRISELLEMFEIAHLRNRLTGALSSGEKTRLNLAKCLLNDPELLILDEPTASLDPDMSDKVRTVLKHIRKTRRLGILYTSHNMFEVEDLCDRIIFIHHGKTMAEGTPDEVRRALAADTLEQAFIKVARSGAILTGEES